MQIDEKTRELDAIKNSIEEHKKTDADVLEALNKL
jgi:hypothetical protein